MRVGFSPAIGPLDRDDVVRAAHRARTLSVALHEVRPAQLRPLLRSDELDLALSRARGLDDTALSVARCGRRRWSSACRCGTGSPARPRRPSATLDGERLLVPSPPRDAVHRPAVEQRPRPGAIVTLVEAHVTGGAAILSELTEVDAVALQPRGTPVPPGVASVSISSGLRLPLYVLWATGRPAPAAQRVIAALAPTDDRRAPG